MNVMQRILIIDEDQEHAGHLRKLLGSEGYVVALAETGAAGLSMVKEFHPVLVLLEVGLPDLNGFEVCRRIKSNPCHDDLVVVLFSDKSTAFGSRAEGLECGADDFMVKPFQQMDFLARIAALFKIKQAEEKARRSHQEVYQIVSSIQSLLIVLDENNVITRWNWVAANLLGVSYEDACNRQLDKLTLYWDNEQVLEAVQSCRANMFSMRIDDLWFERPGGKNGFLKLRIDPIMNIQGQGVSGVLLLGEDVTERRLLESQLLQAQKLESIGQLAAGVAHEINTPIQFVSDNVRFLKDAFNDLNNLIAGSRSLILEKHTDDPCDERTDALRQMHDAFDLEYLIKEVPLAIHQSLDGLERVAHIVRSMKSFAHPGEMNMVLADINKALADTVTVSRNEWKYVAEMHMDLDQDLPRIPCYLSELNQAFLNIVTNAAQAVAQANEEQSREMGLIAISTHSVEKWMEIRITDNGAGIPDEIKPRLFDPFFTTKEVGKGTGQGLVIVHNAVVKHGGTVAVDTKVGRGTTFIIRLPVTTSDNDVLREPTL